MRLKSGIIYLTLTLVTVAIGGFSGCGEDYSNEIVALQAEVNDLQRLSGDGLARWNNDGILEAETIQLVDTDGRVRALLDTVDGEVAFMLIDSNGEPVSFLVVDSEGIASLNLHSGEEYNEGNPAWSSLDPNALILASEDGSMAGFFVFGDVPGLLMTNSDGAGVYARVEVIDGKTAIIFYDEEDNVILSSAWSDEPDA